MLKIALSAFLFVFPSFLFSQETIPIYSDYLSDNVFLVHPSAAGIGNCGKFRFTARTQWSGVQDSPSLQTMTAHNRFGDNTGLGLVLFNDKNGYHSQQGIQGTYAYHINVGARPEETNQLSFALAFMVVNNSVDQSSFTIFDPEISYLVQSKSYFNADISMAYHNRGLFSYVTAKNVILSARNLYNDLYESLNLRRYLATVGYYFDRGESLHFEPSVMGQYIERTGESFIDLNFKAYLDVQDAQIWAAFSYRRGFDKMDTEGLQYLTPIIGMNYKNFMASYTYTKQSGDILFDEGGYHQITLGFNFMCRAPRRSGCPNINYSF